MGESPQFGSLPSPAGEISGFVMGSPPAPGNNGNMSRPKSRRLIAPLAALLAVALVAPPSPARPAPPNFVVGGRALSPKALPLSPKSLESKEPESEAEAPRPEPVRRLRGVCGGPWPSDLEAA